ncbi:hypothetical protein C1A50_2189 [Paenibacillus polymyxa]|nr:hypothetical protein C1A50_2189 [Paenibacillus polymyxa]
MCTNFLIEGHGYVYLHSLYQHKGKKAVKFSPSLLSITP